MNLSLINQKESFLANTFLFRVHKTYYLPGLFLIMSMFNQFIIAFKDYCDVDIIISVLNGRKTGY